MIQLKQGLGLAINFVKAMMIMLKNMSIRLRLTFLSILMLSCCCIGLTILLNLSAFDYIDASATTLPATNITDMAIMPSLEEEMIAAIPLQNAMEAKQGFGSESIFYMLMFILGGGALTYFFVERALRPLHTLNTQVKNLNVNTLSKPLSIPIANDEITELTMSFNDMSDKLHDAFMVQKRFSASVAHEFRTPLAVLQTKIDVFKKKNTCSTEEYEAMIAIFEKQTYRLRELIKRLLEMTTNEEPSEQSSVCLKDVFEELLFDLEPIAKRRNIKLSLQCDDSCITGNIDLLYRAFYNLIENGIHYNHEGGKVDIDVIHTNQKHVEIRISDSGIGICEDAKKHIFEPFYRVEKELQKTDGGVGLGLSIVDNIIKKHHGTISVLDNEKNGTCFKIEF